MYFILVSFSENEYRLLFLLVSKLKGFLTTNEYK